MFVSNQATGDAEIGYRGPAEEAEDKRLLLWKKQEAHLYYMIVLVLTLDDFEIFDFHRT